MSSLKWRKVGTGGRSVDDPPGGRSTNAVGAKGAVADLSIYPSIYLSGVFLDGFWGEKTINNDPK